MQAHYTASTYTDPASKWSHYYDGQAGGMWVGESPGTYPGGSPANHEYLLTVAIHTQAGPARGKNNMLSYEL